MPEHPLSVPATDPRSLDGLIDARIRDFDRTLLQGLLELGALLAHMKRTRDYTRLEPAFATWEDYLASKELGRTYLSYLLKLGLAGDMLPYAERLSASKLIEVARRTDYPEKIPQLLEATADAIAPLTVREAGRVLDEFIQAHPGVYKKSRAYQQARRARTPHQPAAGQTWREHLRARYAELEGAERRRFLAEIEAFLHENGGPTA